MSTKVTLGINWEHQDEPDKNFPLDGAIIEIFEKGDNGDNIPVVFENSQKEITITNGYSLPFYITDITKVFTVRVTATYNDNFSLYADGEIYSQNIDSKLFKIKNDNTGGLVLTHSLKIDKSKEWSVFHAIKDLVNIAKKNLEFTPTIKYRKIYLGDSGPSYNPNDKSISLRHNDSFVWDIIAHEFAHAVLNETNSVDMSQGGGKHDGSNIYDLHGLGAIGDSDMEKYGKEYNEIDFVTKFKKITDLKQTLFKLTFGFTNEETTEAERNEINKEIDEVAKLLEEAFHEFSPEFIQTYGNACYHDEKKAKSLAFAEGCACWLGMSMLTHSIYKYDAEIDKSIHTVGTSKYSRGIKDTKSKKFIDRDFDETIDPLHSDYFGEDAEFAIARLLWNITNKKNGEFVRAHKGEKNQINITLSTLFTEVFLGKGLSDIQSLRWYLTRYLKLFVRLSNFPLHNEEWKKGVNDLNYLFAEFGMVPYMEDADIKNTIRWTQYKTGSLPPGRITLYMENVKYGELHVMKEESLYGGPTIGTKRIEEDKVVYEYKLSTEELISIRVRFRDLYHKYDWGKDENGKSIRVPIIDKGDKITIAVEMGGSYSNIQTMAYKPLNPICKSVLEIRLPDDAEIRLNSNDSIYGKVHQSYHDGSYSGTFGTYYLRGTNGVALNVATLDYEGWEGYEDMIPKFSISYELDGYQTKAYGDSVYNRYNFYQHDLG